MMCSNRSKRSGTAQIPQPGNRPQRTIQTVRDGGGQDFSGGEGNLLPCEANGAVH
jgi:hypothetical protein